ncbi:MAG: Mo-dependent nitrogenase C-terminal domain-containing protein [Cyanobacteria bacterium J06641_2]
MFNSIKPAPEQTFNSINFQIPSFRGLYPIRQWLNNHEINNPVLAHFLCRMIPTQCPFERDICLFGRTIVSIPPLCKLNPLYEEVVGLRFRALCYLADECGEDVGCYC